MCSEPLPSNRGAYCVGYSFDQKSCDNSAKPCNETSVNGAWSNWTEVKKNFYVIILINLTNIILI